MKKCDIEQLYTQCIQLCNTKKVTKKNAWEMPLIDIMEEVINDNKKTTFQTASTSIDASLQIYSCRVDDVYQAFYSFANHLNVNSEIEDDEDAYPEVSVHEKKNKKRTKKCETLEKNSTNLLSVKKGNDPMKRYTLDLLMKVFLEETSFTKYQVSGGGRIKGDWKDKMSIDDCEIPSKECDENKIIDSSYINFDTLENCFSPKEISKAPCAITPKMECDAMEDQSHDVEAIENDAGISRAVKESLKENGDILGISVNEGGYTYYAPMVFKEWVRRPKKAKAPCVRVKKSDIDFTKCVPAMNLPSEDQLKTFVSKKRKGLESGSCLDVPLLLKWTDEYEPLPTDPWDQDVRIPSIPQNCEIEKETISKLEETNMNEKQSSIIDGTIDNGFEKREEDCETFRTVEAPRLFNRIVIKPVDHPKLLDYETLEKMIFEFVNSSQENVSLIDIIKHLHMNLPQNLAIEATPHYCFVALLVLANKKKVKLINETVNKLFVTH
ncbi:hypothetical protein EIN_267910 [Entamoeba invadens IP1]|uniref:Condensin complex subunit 2 n=1 Tax=Entamoeba invadens IP1 TaxID=370355 RepID=A0A0A1UE28_ENTIV|nr:hypothetical protein EIN_267910 [Entamoeba invadens IP1]ELP91055.1 hypothetical protein EIN_267910 [Entamoeba invadens IP1]|eukprot:XP_004257826.1 hypothetical protein EIN_267910 [Entamoeba invadens IP1]